MVFELESVFMPPSDLFQTQQQRQHQAQEPFLGSNSSIQGEVPSPSDGLELKNMNMFFDLHDYDGMDDLGDIFSGAQDREEDFALDFSTSESLGVRLFDESSSHASGASEAWPSSPETHSYIEPCKSKVFASHMQDVPQMYMPPMPQPTPLDLEPTLQVTERQLDEQLAKSGTGVFVTSAPNQSVGHRVPERFPAQSRLCHDSQVFDKPYAQHAPVVKSPALVTESPEEPFRPVVPTMDNAATLKRKHAELAAAKKMPQRSSNKVPKKSNSAATPMNREAQLMKDSSSPLLAKAMAKVPASAPAPVSAPVPVAASATAPSKSQKVGVSSGKPAAPVSTKIFYRRSWTPEEDEELARLVAKHGATNWRFIALQLDTGKTGNQCSQRWQKALDPVIVKGKWSQEEDMALRAAVDKLGFKWKEISKLVLGRTGKQCRDRYTSKLNPKIHLGPWTEKEEQIALKAHKAYGNKWAAIQKLLPDRAWYTIKWKIECLKGVKGANKNSAAQSRAAKK